MIESMLRLPSSETPQEGFGLDSENHNRMYAVIAYEFFIIKLLWH